MSKLDTVTAGFLPLTDAMILIAAREKGFAEAEGIDLLLSKQLSWASIRDHMAVGHLDVAHMLAPMPIAFNAGLVPFSASVIAPMALGLGGNAVTISLKLKQDIETRGALVGSDPLHNGMMLKSLIEHNRSNGGRILRFGVVHSFSGHNLELRYWLASCGIDPENDVEILIVPPPLMPDALASGQIDGFCVGEPWNSVSVEAGVGYILTTKSQIWHSSPEKVLGARKEWAGENPDLLFRVLKAMVAAAKWCSKAEHHDDLADTLSNSRYLDLQTSTLRKALSGRIELCRGIESQFDDFLVPYDRAATFPWQSHALWFYSQMVRWGQLVHTEQNLNLAKESFRPDLYRKAISDSDASIPSANMKVEGALTQETPVGSTGRLSLGPDGFFDGKIFDPDEVDAYIASFSS